MWKHKNFINLQLYAGEIVGYSIPAGTYTFKDTLTMPEETIGDIFNFTSNGVNYTRLDVYTSKGGSVVYIGQGDTTVYAYGAWNEAYKTITVNDDHNGTSFAFYTWFNENITATPQPTLTFKHFYDAGTMGTGTVKFRHYSQQEPSSG